MGKSLTYKVGSNHEVQRGKTKRIGLALNDRWTWRGLRRDPVLASFMST